MGKRGCVNHRIETGDVNRRFFVNGYSGKCVAGHDGKVVVIARTGKLEIAVLASEGDTLIFKLGLPRAIEGEYTPLRNLTAYSENVEEQRETYRHYSKMLG